MIDPLTQTVVAVTALGCLLAETLTGRKLNGQWPEAIPPHWPQGWKERFARQRANPDRTVSWVTLKSQIKSLEGRYRSKVKNVIWSTRDHRRVTVSEMTESHLSNALMYTKRHRQWAAWVVLVVEYRHRLAAARKKGPVTKASMSFRDLKKILKKKG